MSELMSIASRKRTACNGIFVWSSVAKTTAESSSSTGYRERHRQEAVTAYIHDLCRASDICPRHIATVYRDCRKCRVPRRIAFSPFFFTLPTVA